MGMCAKCSGVYGSGWRSQLLQLVLRMFLQMSWHVCDIAEREHSGVCVCIRYSAK